MISNIFILGILSDSTIKDQSKSIQIEPNITVTNTTDTIDVETVKDDADKACTKSEFKVVDKCRHRVDIDLKHDKQMECESTFGGEEVCTLFCACAGSLFRGKKEHYTNIICPRKSDENTTRVAVSMKKLTSRSKIPCKGMLHMSHSKFYMYCETNALKLVSFFFFMHFCPGTTTTHAGSINSDLQRGLDRRLRHTQH